ncbi:MAG: hypothetical protein U9Q05_03670 [Thermodesulfobacteriota bacterium]|nr:hypothetical protein [Thermodesulfobacteriota bacterium]
MSFLERFTEEEQQLLSSTPILIGSAMAFAESSGLATVKELLASAKTYAGGLKAYPQNEIIQGILPNMEDRKEAMAQAKDLRQKTIARLKDKGIDSPEKIRELLLADTREIADLLAQKASPEETFEYKDWAMEVAGNVARAAKEGGFLGFGGERVSAGEKALFAELADVLGSDSQLT